MNRVGACGAHAQLGGLAGLDFVEVSVREFLVPASDEDAFRAASAGADRAAAPVEAANCFLPAALKSTGPDLDMDALTAYAASAFRRAASAGIRTIVFGSGGSRKLPGGFDRSAAEEQFVGVLGAFGPLAAESGVTLVVEPLNRAECNLINSLDEGAEAVRACGHPHVRLLADLYHMLREDEPPEAIARNGELIRHVHVAERERRTAPGTAGDDFRSYLRALAESGYRGDFSLECRCEDAAREIPSGAAELRAQIRDVS
jgi:sugar phosphate isomerase/epimerase